MAKTEVYSWRVSREMKEALEEHARAEGKTMAKLLDDIVGGWLDEHGAGEDAAEQRRLHAAAAKTIGTIHGDDPHLSQQVGQRVREILRKKYGR
jgi:predicted DNA-binding protein